MTHPLQIDASIRLDSFRVKVDDHQHFATVRLGPATGYNTSLTLFVKDHTEANMLASGFDAINQRRADQALAAEKTDG